MTENEFEKRFMAEMSEQQNTAVKAVQGAVLLLAVPGSYVEVISACVSQAEGIVLLNKAGIYDKLLWHQPL